MQALLRAAAGFPKVNAALTAVLRIAEILQRFNDLVVEATPAGREAYARCIGAEIARWARVSKDAGIA